MEPGNKPTQRGGSPFLAGPVSSPTATRPPMLLDRRQRIWSIVTGALLIGLLVVARVLTPNAAGMGTHQQLGLPPCTFDFMFGVRCPSCGMTTSWSHLMRGDLAASWHANPGGLCLAIVAAIAGVWSFVTAYNGKYRPWVSQRVMLAVTISIIAITLVDWVGKVF